MAMMFSSPRVPPPPFFDPDERQRIRPRPGGWQPEFAKPPKRRPVWPIVLAVLGSLFPWVLLAAGLWLMSADFTVDNWF